MMNNDVLRSIRYTLDISDGKLADIIRLGGLETTKAQVIAYTKKEEEDGFEPCSDEVLAYFLDGLVFFKRGKDETRPSLSIELPMTNNIILKKLRVAFELKEEDLLAILQASDFPISKPELSALFRKPGHNNYRPCGEQLLRNFLRGLTLRIRG
ncbi:MULTISPECIES: DUF1456 family protein [unclassified Pseudomonas]|uniref:DUF1456 family protein n=1 Tax=unclassified Pseudomonas TaxID=196821 RepID=UPI000D3A732B|nr:MULTISPECIES: DUF1456 family protein [unclassified Pseudomonas]RAU49394.1 DUF1456 family protein [Pseudomonas sp. RIT 409]RAU55866.1 DUF1456 family protein [Pseudomonas sp. RIT 412]